MSWSIAGEHYRGLSLASSDADGPLVVSLLSRDQAMAPYRRIQTGLLVLGLIAVGVGILGSALMARSITDPVGRLREGTRQVAAGNYEFRIDVDRSDELGELASSFNQMTDGLRERAEMSKFVSQSTVDMIHTHTRATSTGERREVTVFFSDIRGFTDLAERLPPEEAVALLNRCLSTQADLVKKFHGDVDKFVGDAVFALFAGDDMTLNAIRCAVEIHHAMEQVEVGAVGAPLTLGIGIVSGEVVLGSVGSAERLDYTALGSNVNLCSRLCSEANPREILMSEATYLPRGRSDCGRARGTADGEGIHIAGPSLPDDRPRPRVASRVLEFSCPRVLLAIGVPRVVLSELVLVGLVGERAFVQGEVVHSQPGGWHGNLLHGGRGPSGDRGETIGALAADPAQTRRPCPSR